MKNKHLYIDKLIAGDTLIILRDMPSAIVDLSVTSPPYNKQEKNNGGLVKRVVYDDYRDTLSEEEYQARQVATLNEIYRVTKEGGSMFYNHKIRWERGEMFHPMDWLRRTDWLVKQEIIWDRTLAGNIRGWRFWQVEERIYWLYKPQNGVKLGKELKSKDAKLTSIWRAVPENNNPHPAPFPLWLPARIILSMLEQGESALVLDPYIGSGTTAVAARLLGFNYLGIDISQQYLRHAKQRIETAAQEIEKIEKEIGLHQIQKTFKQRKAEGLYPPRKNKEITVSLKDRPL